MAGNIDVRLALFLALGQSRYYVCNKVLDCGGAKLGSSESETVTVEVYFPIVVVSNVSLWQ
ncbi:hypothetical protein TorRG33x02_098400 [Trema orientale]|uniref:Uncharacterized protein n=1 Tax=Trema orientale TaxID=63057 RepID=A0A2P5F9C3_TREOI|nr:hypothetical protein TorRG33x02_098400 [Trema orientale]